MKIPGLDDLFGDLAERGDEMQDTLNRIEALLIQIEENTRPRIYKIDTTTQQGEVKPLLTFK